MQAQLDENIGFFLWNNERKAWILLLFNLHNFFLCETIKKKEFINIDIYETTTFMIAK